MPVRAYTSQSLHENLALYETKTIWARCQLECGQWGHYIASVLRLVPDVVRDPEAQLQEEVAGSDVCAFVLLVARTAVWDSPHYFPYFCVTVGAESQKGSCHTASPNPFLPFFSQIFFCESDNCVIIIPLPHSSAWESAHLMVWVATAGVQSCLLSVCIHEIHQNLPTNNKPLLHGRSIAKYKRTSLEL